MTDTLTPPETAVRVQQMYTNCLAQGAYYIESDGEAAVIDPLREVKPYLELAARRGATIKYIFETHFHADFVSGHVDLSRKTGAPIVYGPTEMATGFDSIIATDGQEFKIGRVTVRLIHTPGHTLESSCYLLLDEHGQQKALFTGDTLFIGDVGRPDLAQHVVKELTQEKLASMLFDSLRNKILPLNNDVIVYPGHGAGSACGKNMSNETSDTLGNQKKSNYALRNDLSREQFVEEVLTGLTRPPGYFPKNVLLNIRGYEAIDQVLQRGTRPLAVSDFSNLAERQDVLLLDTRDAQAFAKEHIPGAVNIGLNGSFAVWVGTLVKDIDQKIIFVAEGGREEEVATRLARVGYDQCLGYLQGGISAWKVCGLPTASIESITAAALAGRIKAQPAELVDVRKQSEYRAQHVANAINAPLDYVDDSAAKLQADKPYYVYCAGGYRSMAFISLLRRKGFNQLVDVAGGFKAISEVKTFQLTDYVCPTTML